MVLAGMFLVGPALAAQAAGHRIFTVISGALGIIPASAVRLCTVVFLPVWMGLLVAPVVRYLVWWAELSRLAAGALVWAVVAFVFATAHQRPRTQGQLALFSCKLFGAIAIAAFVRVRDGWETVGYRPADWQQIQFGLSALARYSAPLALLAADFVSRGSTRKDVVRIGFFGMALPLFLAMAISGFLAAVTHASRLYVPSLTPTIGMALWSQVAASATPPRMIVAMITVFGAMRFAARSATGAAAMPEKPTWRSWTIAACLIIATTWCCLQSWNRLLESVLDWSGRCLGVTSAVITAGFLAGRRGLSEQRRIDWVGTGALIVGLGTPLYIRHGEMMYDPNPWWWPWLLPSYVVGFVVCLCGRLVENLLARRSQLRQN
jgi:hypothetical protein